MTVRTAIIILNVVAAVVLAVTVAWRVLSLRRNPDESEPQNLSPAYPDDVLETSKLERVLFWSLICSGILALALPLYWLREPNRQAEATDGFDERSVERGAELYADQTMETYNATVSLGCASCHGANGEGGTAPTILQPPEEGAAPVRVSWQAPALDTVLLRYPREQVKQILVYGRPGTPMPAWGVEGGGSKNDQAIEDVLNYLETIQLSPAGAKQLQANPVEAAVAEAEDQLERARANLAQAEEGLAAAGTAEDRRLAEEAVELAEQAVESTEARLAEVEDATAGQILFEDNCARCHTQGWNYYDPTDARIPLPAEQGSGGFGPNLTGGVTVQQFPGPTGVADMVAFVTQGSLFQKPYGVRGIGSGRMPGFGQVLSEEQIQAIVEYERDL